VLLDRPAILEAISRKPKVHGFVIDRRYDRPAVARAAPRVVIVWTCSPR
jgi:hypothetical protein